MSHHRSGVVRPVVVQANRAVRLTPPSRLQGPATVTAPGANDDPATSPFAITFAIRTMRSLRSPSPLDLFDRLKQQVFQQLRQGPAALLLRRC